MILLPLTHKQKTSRLIEFLILFIAVPEVFYFYANHWNIALILWGAALYAAAQLQRSHFIHWKNVWNGAGWKHEHKKAALLRFCVAAPLLILLAYELVPMRMFNLPMQRPVFWLLIMFLYPLLSVVPQELLFRSFFFERYKNLFQNDLAMILISGICFGFMHVIFHNFISPALCVIGGLMFAYSYSQHGSLKWAVIEHSAYGCLLFTAGLGYYFFIGGLSRI